jgi:hypothetical protein
MRRKKAFGGGAANFWPGYVDAMTNVVLNLLFMVAMFGITLAVFAQQGRGGDDSGQPKEETLKQPPEATFGWPDLAGSFAALPRQPGQAGLPSNVAMPPLPPVAGPLGSSRTMSGTGQPGAGPLASSQGGSGQSNIGVAAGTPSASAGGDAQSAGRDGGTRGNNRSNASGDQADILVADAYERRAGPAVVLTRRTDVNGRTILMVDVPNGSDPVGPLQRASVAAALRGVVPPGSQRVKLWTSVPRADPASRRTAYLALSTLRNQLLAIGLPASAMEVRVYEGSGPQSGGLRLYVVATP